ncbi:antitoxin Xre/MbcA/ParS toxin-binding domain-containing protein [Methylocystis iwaonis]|uniref:type II RES/Xre toxin-antitoxin system antitoxin n=1 Tax=Methylocystis iwaonis TaxID=2885079 RepID=UPI002E7BDD48|nr:antitoxin Xre/MbcA/ParS toxin-binding domain-containing protein [Methylocystis iwaonis]
MSGGNALDFAKVGAILEIGATDSREAAEATRRGLPVAALDEVVKSGRLTLTEADRIVLPRKTLAHRRKIGTLTPDQSDRLIRVARVIAVAETTFGSKEKASRWLRRPTTAFDGDAPISLLDTSEGSRQVEHFLARIGHGLAA